ncbi:carbohydrate porin [Ruficoccus amylovorans]|uniref:Carbohydrate porin n=1 Tax=Ruficoccus amylovorans TaxID=1804625 RepID=A0A842HGZ2_9BACT|nr:carbohydrate porin [Ruficoccus amylovorans]MBC2595995.1 carbohydrate porin [Ruficoccus amylovorans]
MKRFTLPFTCLALCAANVYAEDPEAPTPIPEPASADQSFWTQEYLTGDWGGVRTELADYGVSFEFTNILDYYDDISGALSGGGTVFNRVRGTMNLDLDKLIGFTNAKFSVGGVSQFGSNYNRSHFGVLTNPSSIEGVNTTRFAQIWLEQTLFDNMLTYRIGKVDGVGAFGAQPYGGTFMNDELAYIPNLLFAAGLPFDPAQQLGAIITLRPFEDSQLEGTYVKAGVFNTNNNNAINFDNIGTDFNTDGPVAVAGEIGYNFGATPADMPGYVKAGIHHNFGSFVEVNSPNTSQGNTLFYVNVGKTIYKFDEDGERHLDASLSFSYAPKQNVNVYHYEMTALLRAIGPFASRPFDEAGLGFIAAWLTDDYSNSTPTTGTDPSGNEFTVELTYKARLTPWFTLQPDFQVVVNPNGNGSRSPVYIAGIRNVISF